eukprot:TRINITY_DN1712_c0_g1_i4.p1 TRINITY_DN1712_c0_g1~~TRINITY_DN1712_c0_g1_i4.p1  ORF type:complete len:253 (+),score=67.54 TRINITY_DN1712_c0_g1_i4:55-813(+)
MPLLLEEAWRAGARVAVHLEPYVGRNAATTAADLAYLSATYGASPALYRDPATNLPVVYVYDSYHTSAAEWATVLTRAGGRSVRGTSSDAVVLALLVTPDDWSLVSRGGFDGVYTYFASDGFTYGSNSGGWPLLRQKATDLHCLLSLSVGPGYIDTRIRPWNSGNTKSRENGAYYERHWEAAMAVQPDFISVTSYNEWHEGTQIEECVSKTIGTSVTARGGSYTYMDYAPLQPHHYLDRTSHHSALFAATFH